jgi:large subunit ribosomal protein L22
MLSIAVGKFVRTSPFKLRRVINMIRGKSLEEAMGILDFTSSTAATPVKKVLGSAAANAENNYAMRKETLYVHECFVDGGPVLKRMRRGSMGRGSMIHKRTSHITVVLSDREEE